MDETVESFYDRYGVYEEYLIRRLFECDQPVLPPEGHLLLVLFEVLDAGRSFTECGGDSWYIGGTDRVPMQLCIHLWDSTLNLQVYDYVLSVDLLDPTSLDRVRDYLDAFPSRFRGLGRLPVRLRDADDAGERTRTHRNANGRGGETAMDATEREQPLTVEESPEPTEHEWDYESEYADIIRGHDHDDREAGFEVEYDEYLDYQAEYGAEYYQAEYDYLDYEHLDYQAEYGAELPIPDDHILNVIFQCRPGCRFYRHAHWGMGYWCLAGVNYFVSVSLDGSCLSLKFGHRARLRVDLNDPKSFEQIQRFLDNCHSSYPGFGLVPVRLRSTEEAQT